jgi:Acetyltransferase (GNAT) domain
MEFDWSPVSHERWRELLAEAPRANLLQSWPYAVAARLHDQMMSRRGLIVDGGRMVGFMQIQEIRLGPIHVVKLYRGPLWLDAEPPEDQWREFLAAFNRSFPRRLGRCRRVLFELDDGEANRVMLRTARFAPKGAEPYRTATLDLEPDLARIRAGLKGNWRNHLAQAERRGFEIACDRDGLDAAEFLAGYAADKARRGYPGPDPARLSTMITAGRGDMLILSARLDGAMAAGVLVFRHGRGATYQAGWTSAGGRAVNAHHRLLWQAVTTLKGDGALNFDLGGVNPSRAEGVTTFKAGLGARAVVLTGLFG